MSRTRWRGVTLLAPALLLSGCFGGPAAASKPTNPPEPTTSTTVRPSPRRPVATTAPAPLPAPSRISPLVAPSLPGEGVWEPATGGRLARGYAIYTTQLRPSLGAAPVGVAWIDTDATRLSLYAGPGQPSGTWPFEGYVAPSAQADLLGAFNAGFKLYSGYQTGWYEDGHSGVPLAAGAASLVIFANGSATVGEWGRDVTLTPEVVAVRQNLVLLVDHGVPVPASESFYGWGAVFGGGTITWRSGVGVTAAGDLIYAGGPSLSPAGLAQVLVAAGAERAMELDINYSWVSFATFAHVGGVTGTSITGGSSLLPAMAHGPSHYLAPYSRDFFAIFAR